MVGEFKSPEHKLIFLSKNIDDRIKSFEKRRESCRSKSFLLTVSLAVISAAVTVFIGIQGVEDSTRVVLLNIALILSALVTVGSVVESFFSPKELWIKYTEAVNLLKELKSDLEYLELGHKDSISVDKLDAIYTKYKKILKETNSTWISMKKSTSKSNKVGA